MNSLKQNPFWLGIAASALVLAGVFFGLVFPLWGQQAAVRKTNSKHLSDLKKLSVPGRPDITHWTGYRSKLIESYTKLTEYYVQSDKHLERWFEGLPEEHNRGDFTSRYADEIRKLEAAVAEKKTVIGLGDPNEEKRKFGFNWEEPTPADFDRMQPDENKRVRKELQKRFWARQRVANIIINGTAKVTRVVDFRFFKRLSPSIQQAPWDAMPAGTEGVNYLGTGDAMGRGGFAEYDLPNELGQTLTFGVTLELPYSEVPKVIGEILNAGYEKTPSERLLVNVIGTHVTIRGQNPLEENITYKRGDRQEFEKAVAEKRKLLKPQDVILTVTCQILDFDPSKLKTFAQ